MKSPLTHTILDDINEKSARVKRQSDTGKDREDKITPLFISVH